MTALEIARWQFGITTSYHFIFVPLTIGLSLIVALMQTIWHVTKDQAYLRMTKFFGTLFLINFAIGVVTGIVQEFQFGMNWSDYSRFVGDVFGGPLALEGLLAFFLESTFLGLWIFGWGRLPPLLHLATIWLVAIGSNVSAFFIMTANSWMQHPVGYHLNPHTHRAELTSIQGLLTNPTNMVAIPHVVLSAILTGGALVLGVSAWNLARRRDTVLFGKAMRLGLAISLVAAIGAGISGDRQARIMVQQQPMKMAAAEALYRTSAPASFSVLTIGTLDGSRELWSIRVPHLLSLLATDSPNGRVRGIYDIDREYRARYGPGSYKPIIPVTYWTFRLMIGLGLLSALLGLAGFWLQRRGRRWFYRVAIAAMALPFIANIMGWTFTEMGRQPWVVVGVLKTGNGVSPAVAPASVILSLSVFTLLYAALAVIAVGLMARVVRSGPPREGQAEESAPVFTY